MDWQYLPLLKQSDQIEKGLQLLKEKATRALIVASDKNFLLYTSKDIVTAYAEKKSLFAEISFDRGMPLTNIDEKPGFNMTAEHHGAPGQILQDSDVESYLSNKGSQYGVIITKDVSKTSMALLVTERERYLNSIVSADKICVCRGPGRHMIKGEKDGQPCEYCPNDYECY